MSDEREYSQSVFFQLRQSFLAVWRLFLLSRLWCALWVYAGHFAHPFREKISGGYEGVSNSWLNAWTVYDSGHFFDIASRGYNATTAPFFPLYPLILRLAAPHKNAMALLGMAVSDAALLAALMLLFLLAQKEASTRRQPRGTAPGENQIPQLATCDEADISAASNATKNDQPSSAGPASTREEQATTRALLPVFLMAFSPLACVFSAVYTDALYAFLLLAAFCCARRVFILASTRAWFFAGTFAALAALTRNSGPIIFAALLCQWFLARRVSTGQCKTDETESSAAAAQTPISKLASTRVQETARITLLPVCFPLLSFLAFQLFLARHFGGFSGVTSHANYGRALMFPLLPIARDALRVLARDGLEPVTLLGLFASIAALWMGFREVRRRAPDAILVLGVMLMQLTLGRIFAPYTNTSLRLMSSNFPFWTMLSRRLENALNPRTRVLAVAFYLLVCALMSFLFGLKTFVSG